MSRHVPLGAALRTIHSLKTYFLQNRLLFCAYGFLPHLLFVTDKDLGKGLRLLLRKSSSGVKVTAHSCSL